MSQSAYKIELRRSVAKEIRKLDKSTQGKVIAAMESLVAEPRRAA